MSIFDAIKNSVLENFNTSVTIADILLGLAVSFLAGCSFSTFTSGSTGRYPSTKGSL